MFNSPYAYPNPYQMNQPQQMMNHSQQVVKVNGRNGAEMYQMPPNSSSLLLDESSPIVWLATTDGAGYKSLTAYDIKPHEEMPMPDMRNLEARIARIEEVLKNESDHTGNGRKITDDGQGKANGSNVKSIK